MSTTSYEHVLTGALALMGLERDRLATLDFDRIRSWAESELQLCWEKDFWPELVKVEKNYFRADYAAATAYTNDGTIVYFPQTQEYYHAVKATTGNPPADANDVQDKANWAVAQEEYSGLNYAAATTYAAGDQVFYPTTGEYYQCHTASTGNLPTDTSYWGRLYLFDRYVAYGSIGDAGADDVIACYDQNPLVHRDAIKIEHGLSDNGVQIWEDVNFVWVRYRTRSPELSGDEFSATATYAVGDQIYYRSTTVVGDFYDCAVATSAGEDPDDTPASWTRVEIPLRFKQVLKQGVLSQYLTSQGQSDSATLARRERDRLLGLQSDKIVNQLNQRKTPNVLTR